MSGCLLAGVGSVMSPAVLQKSFKGPEWPDRFKFEILAHRQMAEDGAIECFGGFHIDDRENSLLPGNFVHCDNLEVFRGGQPFFNFHVPDIFERDAIFYVPAHLHIEQHLAPPFLAGSSLLAWRQSLFVATPSL